MRKLLLFSLVLGALAATAGIAGGNGVPIPPAPAPPPSNQFTVEKSAAYKNGKTVLTVDVPGPGTLIAAQAPEKQAGASNGGPAKPALVNPVTKIIAQAGPVKLRIKPTALGKKKLKKKKKLKVKMALTFTPTGGTPFTVVKTVKIKKTR